MPRLPFNGCTALITGASSGIGAEMARQLAPLAATLILAARREPEMAALAASLRAARPALRVHLIPCDLADPGERIRLVANIEAAGLRPNILVNNAGLGDYGELSSAEWSRLDLLLQVNIGALTHLTRLLLPALKAHAPAGILNVSSLAGELPMPDIAAYAASKSYVTSLSEALRLELREHRVHVTALCPGPVRTGFSAAALRPGEPGPAKWSAVQPVERVVSLALRGLSRNQPLVFPGWNVKLLAFASRVLPRPAVRLILGRRPRRCRTAPGQAE